MVSLASAALVALSARTLPTSTLRIPLGPGGWGPRTFASTELSLPLESTGRPVRLSLRASANVPETLLVHLAGARVGDVLIRGAEPETYELEIPSPVPGQPLDLGFALSLRSLARGVPPEGPLLILEDLQIASPRGLVLRPAACLILGCWPLAAFGFVWLMRLGPPRALAAAVLSAFLAALGAYVVPLHMVRLTPILLGALLAAGLVTRLPLTAREERPPSESATRALLWAAGLSALPAVETSLLLAGFFGRTLLDHIPGFINDAIDYWLEAQAFAHAGWHGGYFTIDERPAPASFSHFGSHGPLFPVLHGTLGRLLGWHPYSIPLFHLGFLTAALLFFARHVPLDRRGRVLTVLCLAAFWPLLFFLPTSLQEGLHIAVAVFLAAAFRPLLDGRETSRRMRVSLLAILLGACLVRPSWGLLLPPALVLLLGATRWRRRALAAVVGVALWAAVLAAFDYTAAPFGREEFLFVRVARLQEGAPALLAHVAANGRRFVQAGTALEVRSRFLVLGLALSLGVLALRAGPRRELAFNAYNLGSVLLATLLTYVFGLWADYRVFSAHLLLTTLLLATSRAAVARRVAAFVLLAHLGSVGPFIQAFKGLGETYRYDAARIEAFGAAARGALVFDARQDPWCNTLLSVNAPYFHPEMVDLPPGIGVTMLLWVSPAREVRSRYVLLDPDNPRGLSLNLRPLVRTPVGQLYQNLDARCPGG